MLNMTRLIIKLFILIQLVLVGGWLAGSEFLPIRTETFLGKGLGGKVSNQPLLWSRANFDGFYYAKIARDGYQHFQQAFFPLYPNLIGFFEKIFGGYVISGVIISAVSLLLFLYFFNKLMKEKGFDDSIRRQSLIYITFFPTAFYFGAAYTEAIFMFLVVLSFYFAQKKRWLFAGLVAGAASYTKVVGIFLVPGLLYEYYDSQAKRDMKTRFVAAKEAIKNRFSLKYIVYLIKSRLPHIRGIGSILTGAWGLITYSLYLKRTTGDFFYFSTAQPQFQTQRTTDRIVLIYQVFWRYLKMIFTVDVTSYTYLIVWVELLIVLLFVFLLLYSWLKANLPPSWLIFSAFAFIVPTLTGTFTSMPRYVLICFPCFISLAKLKLPKYVPYISLVLQFIAAALFLRGYWIA